MDYIGLTKENLAREHICCAIAGEKDPQVAAKKAWLKDRLDEGLVFLRAAARGKCFIEYIPAEYAWVPIDAPGYMHINCFWVSGQFKGHGYSTDLLKACLKDSREKGKRGLCVISSPKKMPFLSDPGHLSHAGFKVADTAEPYFTLMYLPFSQDAPAPVFRAQVKKPLIAQNGFVLYHTHGCPYTAKYAPVIEAIAVEMGVPFQRVLLDSREAAQNAPAAWTNYALFCDGRFVTNEILSEKKFRAMAEAYRTGGEGHGV